jgi:hypothetical protein
MANSSYDYITGATILNTSDQAVSGSIQYYKTDGSMQGSPQTFSIVAHASQVMYQGGSVAALPDGFYGCQTSGNSASSNGGSLIVTTNAISSSFFYTYTEPNS